MDTARDCKQLYQLKEIISHTSPGSFYFSCAYQSDRLTDLAQQLKVPCDCVVYHFYKQDADTIVIKEAVGGNKTYKPIRAIIIHRSRLVEEITKIIKMNRDEGVFNKYGDDDIYFRTINMTTTLTLSGVRNIDVISRCIANEMELALYPVTPAPSVGERSVINLYDIE